MELKILQALVSGRKFWEESNDLLIENIKEFSPETNYLIDKIGGFYSSDPNAAIVDIEILCKQIERDFPNPKRAERIISVLKGLPSEVSSINVLKELYAVKRDNIALQLVALLNQGNSEAGGILKLMEDFKGVAEAAGAGEAVYGDIEPLESVKVCDLVEHEFNGKNLIQLWPKALNDRCDGGAKPGHHILVFAPTEMGKTLFVINLVAGFIHQGLRTLYIGNEDPAADIYMRYITRLVERDKKQVIANPDKAQKILDAKNYGLLTLVPLAPGNFNQINKLVEKYDAKIVVLDQLRNLDVRSEGRTQQLEKAATEARNLAKSRSVLVISVTQAGDSATGKRVLGRGDVDSSNVGIPGQVDLMIGIGATAEEEQRNMRVISMPKNKLAGNHEHFVVTIDPQTSRVLE